MLVNTTLLNGSKKGFGGGFQKRKIQGNFWFYFSSLMICILMGLGFTNPVQAADTLDPNINSPVINNQYVPVNSPIIVNFGRNITFSNDLTKITLKKIVDPTTKNDIPIQSITPSGQTLTITPKGNLDFASDYVLDIALDAVTDADQGNAQFLTQTNEINFSTNYCTFTQMMIDNSSSPNIDEWLNTDGYTPRDIKIFAPTRYINGVDVLHKNNSAVTSDSKDDVSGSVTNFDITTDSRILGVKVSIDDGTPRDAKLLQSSGSTNVFTVGFAGQTASFDFTVTAYLDKDETVVGDSHTETFAKDTKPIVEFKKTYHYRTSGKSYTLYDLMRNISNFQSLLTENTTDEIKAQVVSSVAK
jgi:hypothetical protein